MAVLPWHHRWNVLALTTLALVLTVGIPTYCFAFWVVPWTEEFNAPRSQLMLVISVCTVVIGLISPIAGALFDRYPVRRMFSLGVLVLALSFVLMSFATSHWVILLLYAGPLAIGVVLATNLFAQITVTRWFTANRGFAMGLSALGISIGAFLMPPIATALLAAYGWRVTFRVLGAAIFLILAPPAWLVLGRKPDAAPVLPAGHADLGSSAQTSWTTAQLLRNRDFWLIAGAYSAIMVACLPVIFAVGTYARDLGITQQQAAFAASLGALAFAVSKLSFGKLSDILSHKLAYRLAAGLMIAGIGLFSAASSLPLFATGLMLMNLGQGCVLPLSGAMVVGRFGTRAFGQVLGLAWTFIGMGSISPFFAGLIRDAVGSYPIAFMVMTAPLLLAAFAMRWLSRPN